MFSRIFVVCEPCSLWRFVIEFRMDWDSQPGPICSWYSSSLPFQQPYTLATFTSGHQNSYYGFNQQCQRRRNSKIWQRTLYLKGSTIYNSNFFTSLYVAINMPSSFLLFLIAIWLTHHFHEYIFYEDTFSKCSAISR